MQEVISISTIQRFCNDNIGKIKSASQQGGGLVHFVYHVTGETDSIYVKIRKSQFATIPSIQINADDIYYEKIGLQIMNKICPGVFPKLLHYSFAHSFLVLEDVFKNGGITLKNYFDGGEIQGQVFNNLGAAVGQVLQKSSKIIWGREELFPASRYEQNLKYRVGFINSPSTDQLMDQLLNDQKQVILGDLAPKNIGIVSDGSIKLFDLDLISFGSKCFDLGYLIGHLIIEGCRYGTEALKAILSSFFTGYKIFDDDLRLEFQSTIKTALATIIYRLENKMIPYEIDLNESLKQFLLQRSYALLKLKKVKWHQLIN